MMEDDDKRNEEDMEGAELSDESLDGLGEIDEDEDEADESLFDSEEEEE